MLFNDFRDPHRPQAKAPPAENDRVLFKGGNAGLGSVWVSQRAQREAVICCVASLEKGWPFPAERAVQPTASRHAENVKQYEILR